MNDYFLLEWTFSPVDFFEAPTEVRGTRYSISIESGRIQARVDPAFYPADHTLRTFLQQELNARFLGVQVLTHMAYSLSKARVFRIHADGRRDAWVFPEPVALQTTWGRADVVLRDRAGMIVRDTKLERINRKNEMADLAAAHAPADAVAESILRSYSAAVNDPANELIHLYEIRDALKKSFKSQAKATAALDMASGQWRRLDRLANTEPLSQGRHRGQHAGNLRDATPEEIAEAREIARMMVEGYLRYLDRQAKP
jgi:hypothetical protein